MDSRTQLSASILIGACIVGTGLYCGLRERAAPVDEVPIAEREADSAGRSGVHPNAGPDRVSTPGRVDPIDRPRALGRDVPRSQPTSEVADVTERTPSAPPSAPLTPSHRAAMSAFDEIRQDVVDDCWSPGADDSASAQLTLSLSFDPAGKLVGQGVHQPARGHVGLGTCVARKLSTLRIEGTGARVRVDIPVALP